MINSHFQLCFWAFHCNLVSCSVTQHDNMIYMTADMTSNMTADMTSIVTTLISPFVAAASQGYGKYSATIMKTKILKLTLKLSWFLCLCILRGLVLTLNYVHIFWCRCGNCIRITVVKQYLSVQYHQHHQVPPVQIPQAVYICTHSVHMYNKNNHCTTGHLYNIWNYNLINKFVILNQIH